MTAAPATAPRGATPPAGSNRLPTLAAGIRDHLREAEAATRRGLEHAVAAGQLLIEAKELVDHGGWLAWLDANCRVGARQAQTFMKLARHRHELEAIVKCESGAHLTIAIAIALVGRPRPERPRGLPGQLDLLGGPEVTALPAASAPARRSPLADLIADLEQALAIVNSAIAPSGRSKDIARHLRRLADVLGTAIPLLKSQRERRPSRRPRASASSRPGVRP